MYVGSLVDVSGVSVFKVEMSVHVGGSVGMMSGWGQ